MLSTALPDGVGRIVEWWKTIGLSSHRTKFLSFPQRDKNLMRSYVRWQNRTWPILKYLNSGYLSVLLNFSLLKKLKSNFSSFMAAVQWNILESSWQDMEQIYGNSLSVNHVTLQHKYIMTKIPERAGHGDLHRRNIPSPWFNWFDFVCHHNETFSEGALLSAHPWARLLALCVVAPLGKASCGGGPLGCQWSHCHALKGQAWYFWMGYPSPEHLCSIEMALRSLIRLLIYIFVI